MSAIGHFTFVLHSHLPHVQPHRYYSATWFYDILAETYLPLLNMLHDLKHDGIAYHLVIGFSPILLEQLSDPAHLEHFDQYLQEKIRFAEHDLSQFGEKAPDNHLHFLAGWYKSWYEGVRESFNKRFNRNIIGGYKELADAGFIDLITSATTHAYLPLIDDKGIKAQLISAQKIHQRHFGTIPTGVWLPECAYKPGMEKILADRGFKYFFTESHPVTGGQPIGVASGDILGLYGEVKRRYMTPPMVQIPMRKQIKTMLPYWVENNAKASSGVAVIGRDNRTGQQVWSNDWGYPGDFDYREHRKKSGSGGLRYWRVMPQVGDQYRHTASRDDGLRCRERFSARAGRDRLPGSLCYPCRHGCAEALKVGLGVHVVSFTCSSLGRCARVPASRAHAPCAAAHARRQAAPSGSVAAAVRPARRVEALAWAVAVGAPAPTAQGDARPRLRPSPVGQATCPESADVPFLAPSSRLMFGPSGWLGSGRFLLPALAAHGQHASVRQGSAFAAAKAFLAGAEGPPCAFLSLGVVRP